MNINDKFCDHFFCIENIKFPYHLVQTHYNGCKNINYVDFYSKKPKIICLGCSITYGTNKNSYDNIKIDNSYSKYLNDFLYYKYSFINMGICGSGLKFQIEWFKFYFKNIKNINTVILQISDYQRQPMKPWQNDNLYHHTSDFGARILLKNMNHEIPLSKCKKIFYCEILDFKRYYTEIINQDFIENQFELIKDFHKFLNSLGINLVIFYYEYWDKFLQLKTLNIEYFNKIKKYCYYNNIKLLPKLSTFTLEKNNFLYDGIHLNDNGNKLISKMISTYLL
jgi:hypothetical protein